MKSIFIYLQGVLRLLIQKTMLLIGPPRLRSNPPKQSLLKSFFAVN